MGIRCMVHGNPVVVGDLLHLGPPIYWVWIDSWSLCCRASSSLEDFKSATVSTVTPRVLKVEVVCSGV